MVITQLRDIDERYGSMRLTSKVLLFLVALLPCLLLVHLAGATTKTPRPANGEFEGESSQYFAEHFGLINGSGLSYRFRWSGRCTYDPVISSGKPPSIATVLTDSARIDEPRGQPPLIYPPIRKSADGHIRLRHTVRIAADDRVSAITLNFDGRFITPNRLAGTAQFTSNTYNSEFKRTEARCVSSRISFVARRLA
jgi:hypothetical protein